MKANVYDPALKIFGFKREGTNKDGKAYNAMVTVEHPAIIGGQTGLRIDVAEALVDIARDKDDKLTPERALRVIQALEASAVKVRDARGGKKSLGGRVVPGERL
jgi:hypothetical protein